MKTIKGKTVYSMLCAVWILVCVWLVFEHSRVKQAARAALLDRARDISSSLGIVIRSQSRFFGIVRHSQLEAALNDLAKSKELEAVALLNSSGEVVASAGESIELKSDELVGGIDRWGKTSVILINLVDLGGNDDDSSTTGATPIIIRRSEPPPSRSRDGQTSSTFRFQSDGRNRGFSRNRDNQTTATYGPPRDGPPREGRVRESSRERNRPRRFGRPPWMSNEEYQELLKKQGLHGFVIQMSTDAYRLECNRDFGLRVGLALIALLAAIGVALTWRYMNRSGQLQVRLLKASEMNTYLREMNVAAAGLAHETRNPLNIVRAQAQLMSQDKNIPDDILLRTDSIIEEVDRITDRLNEFINYSKPPNPNPSPMNLRTVIQDVSRTLEHDIEDKNIQLHLSGPDLTVQADESLVRQVLFNLLLNAIQSVETGGTVEVKIFMSNQGNVTIQVCDDGPGVPVENRGQLFRPYFTTREQGTGLGLAVVRQIVLAHQWDIEYIPGEKGSIFQISGVKVV